MYTVMWCVVCVLATWHRVSLELCEVLVWVAHLAAGRVLALHHHQV